MSLSFKLEKNGQEQILYLSGVIDENADFSKLPVLSDGRLVLDLKNIKHLNSIGLRSWVQWIQKLRHVKSLFLRNCPNVVVHQINILQGFLPMGAIVESFDVPFYCAACENQSSYLAQRGTDYLEATADSSEKILMPLERLCKKCGQIAEADIIVDKHFKFLKRNLT